MPPKVIENEQVKILSNFQIQLVMVNQPDIVAVDKHQKTTVVVDVASPSDGYIGKKEHEKLEKYQQLKKSWKTCRA